MIGTTSGSLRGKALGVVLGSHCLDDVLLFDIDAMDEWVDRLGEKQNNEGKSHPLYPFDRGEISPTCRKAA
jgi:hypothetical protein